MAPQPPIGWQGNQNQSSTAAEYNARDFHIRQTVAEMRTGIPVMVVRAPYDADGNALSPGTNTPVGFIDVKPMVNQIDGYGNATEHGVVYRVTYYRYGNGIFAVYSDPNVGDIGHMAVSDRDVSSAYATNAVANPGSRRMNSLADGTYFGTSRGNAPQSYLVPQTDGSLHLVMPAGKTLAITGNLTVSGTITAGFGGMDQVTLQFHTHPDPQGGNTGAPNPGT